jgi:hypothetical protein
MKISLRFAATTEEEEVCLFCHSSGVWLVGWLVGGKTSFRYPVAFFDPFIPIPIIFVFFAINSSCHSPLDFLLLLDWLRRNLSPTMLSLVLLLFLLGSLRVVSLL